MFKLDGELVAGVATVKEVVKQVAHSNMEYIKEMFHNKKAGVARFMEMSDKCTRRIIWS